MSETSSGLTAAARASTASRSRAARDELVPGPVVLVDGHADDVPQRRQGVAVEFGGLVGAEEFAHRHQQRRPGAGQDVGGLAGGVAGVQRHDDAARVVGGQARDHPVPGVRRPDRDPVAGADAQVDHRRGGPSDLGPQLGERQPPIVGDQGIVVGELVGNPVQDRRNGPRDPRRYAPAADLVIDAPLTKQVLGRLAYRDGRGPGVPGRGPRVAGRQPRRRIRRAQGPRRAGSRGRGVRGTARVEPASRQGRFDLSGLAGRARRPRPFGGAPGRVLRGVRPRRRAGQGQSLRRGTARPDADRVRDAGAAAAVPAAHPRRHRAVVPGLLRARRRQRPGQRVDDGGTRRRPVGDQRPEGLDVDGADVAVVFRGGPHREGLQAARRTVVPVGAAGPAGCRGAPDRAADRDGGFQRGLLRRCPHRRGSGGG